MGSAILRGILRSGIVSPEDVYVTGLTSERSAALASELGCFMVEENAEVFLLCFQDVFDHLLYLLLLGFLI